MDELWKPCYRYENEYSISTHGRIKSLKRKNSSGIHPIMKTHGNSLGYIELQLMKDGKKRTQLMHRLVAETFIEPSHNKHSIVIHLNGNRADNRVENLQWSTKKEQFRNSQLRSNLPVKSSMNFQLQD